MRSRNSIAIAITQLLFSLLIGLFFVEISLLYDNYVRQNFKNQYLRTCAFKNAPNDDGDDKFVGNIHKLGRLISHEWWTVVDREGKAKERYLFLFKSRILVCKVRRISEDRSVFVLKDIIKVHSRPPSQCPVPSPNRIGQTIN